LGLGLEIDFFWVYMGMGSNSDPNTNPKTLKNQAPNSNQKNQVTNPNTQIFVIF